MASSQDPTSPSTGLQWQDFDDEKVFRATEKEAAAAKCRNFVLEFGPNNARINRDLTKEQFDVLLNQESRSSEHPIRWM